mgnify:FL=1
MFKQSIIFALLYVLIGSVVGGVIGKLFSSSLPSVCKEWNKHHVMEISLFFSGLIMYYVWYTYVIAKK